MVGWFPEKKTALLVSAPSSTVTTAGKWSTTVPVLLIVGIMDSVNFAGRGFGAEAAKETVARAAVRRKVMVYCMVMVVLEDLSVDGY